MFRQLFMIAVLALIPLFVGAMPGMTCRLNSDCSNGEYCEVEQMTTGGYVREGTCAADPRGPKNTFNPGRCFSSFDCSARENCIDGRCEESTAGRECTLSSDCGYGMHCENTIRGFVCRADVTSESSSSSSSSAPASNEKPSKPAPTKPAKKCRSDDQCPANFTCEARRCRFNPFGRN